MAETKGAVAVSAKNAVDTGTLDGTQRPGGNFIDSNDIGMGTIERAVADAVLELALGERGADKGTETVMKAKVSVGGWVLGRPLDFDQIQRLTNGTSLEELINGIDPEAIARFERSRREHSAARQTNADSSLSRKQIAMGQQVGKEARSSLAMHLLGREPTDEETWLLDEGVLFMDQIRTMQKATEGDEAAKKATLDIMRQLAKKTPDKFQALVEGGNLFAQQVSGEIISATKVKETPRATRLLEAPTRLPVSPRQPAFAT